MFSRDSDNLRRRLFIWRALLIAILLLPVAGIVFFLRGGQLSRDHAFYRVQFASSLFLDAVERCRHYNDLCQLAYTAHRGAPYSWRLYVTGTSYASLNYVCPGPRVRWDDEYYRVNDEPATRCVFQLDNRNGSRREADLLAVAGEGTAFNAMVVDGLERSALPADCIVLMDASVPHTSWMEPVEIWTDGDEVMLPSPSTSHGRFITFLDGDIWLLEAGTPNEQVAKFLRVDDAKKWNREKELKGYRLAWKHIDVVEYGGEEPANKSDEQE